jgi:hypothetical protein
MQAAPTSHGSAFEVASSLLEITGKAIETGDFDTFAACFKLPQSLGTMDGIRKLTTRDDIRQVFDGVRRRYREMGPYRLDRWIAAALYDGPDEIRSSHVTHVLSTEGRLLMDPFVSMTRLERQAGQWQIADNLYSVNKDTAHGQALLPPGAKQARTRAAAQVAAATSQNLLNRVSKAYLENDLALFLTAVKLPFFVQTIKATAVYETPEDVAAEFRHYTTLFHIRGVTDIVRRVIDAEMVGDRRIHGAFRTHLLNQHHLVIPAYQSAMTMEQGDDLTWRITSHCAPHGAPDQGHVRRCPMAAERETRKMTTPSVATEAYQANLDAVSYILMSGDFSEIATHLALPTEVRIDDVRLHLDSVEDIVAMLSEQRESVLRMGATEYHRICTGAEFTDPEQTRIEGTHTTYILEGGTYLMSPYPCRQWLRFQTGVWRASLLECKVKNVDYSIVGHRTAALLRQRSHDSTFDPAVSPKDQTHAKD